MMGQLQELLSKAAEQLGVAVEAVWGVLLQQTKVELVINVITVIIALLLIGGGIFAGLKMLKAYHKQEQERRWFEVDEWLEPVGWVSLILPPIVGSLVFMCNIRETVQLIFNPPLWVFEYLVKMFQ